MRRLGVLLALLALCLFAAGCGGHDDKGATPLDDALGYFAKDAPFVAAVETDPDAPQIKQLTDLVGRLPVGGLLGERLQSLTRFRSVRWDRDVRPQLGAPLAVGLARPPAGGATGEAVLAAMRLKHPLRAKQTLLRQPGFRGGAESSGVRIYEDSADQRYAAVDGGVLVLATNRDVLEQALALKRGEKRLRERAFDRALAQLPGHALVRVSADPRALLGADARLRPALALKWVSALRRAGAVVKASGSGLTLDLRVATDRGSIADADLPLAPKAGPLPLIGGSGEVQAGVREPGRLARFAFELADAIAPRRMALLRALQPRGIQLERQIPHHMNDVAVLAYDPVTHRYAFRGDLIDAADVKASLAQLAPALPAVGALFGIKGLGVATPEAGESFYALARPNGGVVVFGVLGQSLVVASEAARAAGLASEPTHSAPGGTEGAAVVTLNARELAGRLLAKRLSGPAALLAPLAVGSLRDLTGALTIGRAGLRGHFELTIVK